MIVQFLSDRQQVDVVCLLSLLCGMNIFLCVIGNCLNSVNEHTEAVKSVDWIRKGTVILYFVIF